MLLLSKSNRKSQSGFGRCEKCDVNISNSIWKDQQVIIKPFPNGNSCYCVKCGLNSKYRKIMITEINLDEFIQKGKGILEVTQTPEFIESEFKRRMDVISSRKNSRHQPIIKNRMEVTI